MFAVLDGFSPCALPLLYRLRLSESPLLVQETPSAFHRRQRRNSFHRRDVRPQRRSLARSNPPLKRSPNSNRLC